MMFFCKRLCAAFFKLLTPRLTTTSSYLFAALCLLPGCGSAPPVTASRPTGISAGPPPGFFLPLGTFSKPGSELKPAPGVPRSVSGAPEAPPVMVPSVTPAVFSSLASKPALRLPVPVPVPLVVLQPVPEAASTQLASATVPPQTKAPVTDSAPESASYLCLIFPYFEGCAGIRPPPSTRLVGATSDQPPGLFVPLGTFDNPVSEVKTIDRTPTPASALPVPAMSVSANSPAISLAPVVTTSKAIVPPKPPLFPALVTVGNRPEAQAAIAPLNVPVFTAATASGSPAPKVVVYASPATKAYFSKTSVDGSVNVQAWSVFLRKYQIPFQVIADIEKLEATSAVVLILPSSVALSERERRAVVSFRAKGGSVLASWLTGVRSESGVEVGYEFMEKALDVKVMGTTEAEVKDNFMLPHGDSPVTHHLPAGTRIWLERLKGSYPLRLEGRQTAAQIMDWSRTPVFGKATSTIVFDEHIQPSGRASRSVVLGYPEQLWASADPRQLEAIAHNAVMWLLRQPDAYTAAWPYPYSSAFVMAVDLAGAVSDADLAYAKLLEAAGGHGTFYVLGENVGSYANKLNRLITAGHEVAYLGDSYTDFRGHPEAVQTRRLDSMRKMVKDSGVEIAADAGFHAPMDSYDKTTEKLLKIGSFGHLLAASDASEARLPFFSSGQGGVGPTGGGKALVVLPRTQSGPEDSVDNCQPEVGLKPFLNELDLSEKMAGLSVVSVSGKSELTDAQSAEIFGHLNARRERTWLATAGQVADWWRERERVSARLESGETSSRLVVSILAGAALRQASVVAVNLPEMGSTLRLVARGSYEKAPRIARLDAWRAAVVLDGMAAGDYQWDLYFDHPVPGTD